ncbi:hypothetical protein [Streptomyces cyaneofuscatus]|uniref:hypothetical protein n=1 Tax=Streptomyces cyaneofuscatus TaxID=66883 RepID=UPI003444AF01
MSSAPRGTRQQPNSSSAYAQPATEPARTMVSGGAGRKPALVSRATSASSSQSRKSRSLRWPSSSLTSSSYAAERVQRDDVPFLGTHAAQQVLR